MMTIKFGISGDMGSFSEQAAFDYAKREHISASFVYLIDMEGVLASVERKDIDLGILPVVNLQGGLVRPAYEAMGRHLFTPIDELWLNVQQCLLVIPGTSWEHINTVVSHPQGLAQCKHYLHNKLNQIVQKEWCDTAKAARDLSEGKLPPSTAVIAPVRSAELYGLTILAKNIQDNDSNLTAFILVKHA